MLGDVGIAGISAATSLFASAASAVLSWYDQIQAGNHPNLDPSGPLGVSLLFAGGIIGTDVLMMYGLWGPAVLLEIFTAGVDKYLFARPSKPNVGDATAAGMTQIVQFCMGNFGNTAVCHAVFSA